MAKERYSSLRWQFIIAGIGVILVAGFLLQSASAYETVLVAAGGGRYSEAQIGGPRYINPLLSQANRVDADIVSLVFRGLTKTDECGNVLPDLASSWEISADGRQYIFHLRDDAFWHDGVPVVAADVAFTISLIQAPDFPGLPTLVRLWRDVDVEAMSDKAVRFVLPEPYAPFISYTNLGILPSHVLQGVAAADLTKSSFNRLPVGCGPFAVIESDPEHVLLSANRNFYGERYYLSEIEFRFYRDTGEALRAYQRREVQAIAEVDPEYLPEVAAEAGLSVYSGPLARLVMIILNLREEKGLFREAEVRQALMSGLDRQRLISSVLEGQGLVAHAPFAICSWALDPDGQAYTFDPATAKALLDERGWSDHDGDGFRDKDGQRLSFTIGTTDERNMKAIAQEIARQWAGIGIEVQVNAVNFYDLVDSNLRTREFDAVLIALAVEGDPDPYVLWHSSQIEAGGQNYSGFVNRDADELLEAARREWNTGNRQELYHRFQSIFAEELPALPLYYPVYTFAADRSVRGVHIGPMVQPADRFRYLSEWYVNVNRVKVREDTVPQE